ncbi:hypothetical protein [Actinomadura litoris]|uniref:hypothetical protein n=1 Tax=Actinomadura litoris TaxID=2678616 RepID=UPI001FA7C2F0|nr:hypothetical protein [Actinomadura litoris]
MTGRHREQPSDKGSDEAEGVPRGRRVAVIAAAFAVPVMLATVIAFGLRDEPAAERPEGAATSMPVAPVAPRTEPTYGQYVVPKPQPQAETRAPDRPPVPVVTPRRKVTPKPSRTTRSPRPTRLRPPCPNGWGSVPWWREWCRQHGYRTR